MEIRIIRETETIRYAADELKKYAEMMMDGLSVDITVGGYSEYAVNIGLLSDFSLSAEGVNDAMIDDLVDVDVKCLSGYIAGSNERSCLMGVYNYLKSCGCRWVRPGEAGEYIPKCDISSHAFKFRKLADYPFRGECCEGAISFEHMRDTVLWLPKVNMNMFMIEQIVPYNYMTRWYRHLDNTKLPHDDIPYEQYSEYCLKLERLIKKLGLQLHALGHGAITEPFGVRFMSSGMDYDVPDETLRAFALVNGKRDRVKKYPFYAQLCMSQDWVQDKVVNWLADYLKEKPYIDFLHFWLGDALNNHCECEECEKKTPSDWYVIMLNKLDKKLQEQGNDAKIVFIMYVDTLWPPIEEKLNNPSRFIVTTACGTGSGYSAKRYETGIPKWERNNFVVDECGLPMALSFVDAWKPIFDGTRFVYDYIFYTAHFADLGYMNLARRLAGDAKNLHVTGFCGIMSDQTQRSFFPTGLPMSVMGEFLFDYSYDTESFIEGYMKDAFGEEYKLAMDYLEVISKTFDPEALKQHTGVTVQDTGVQSSASVKKAGIIGNEKLGDIIATAPRIVDDFAPVIEKNLLLTNKCHKESWRILTFHGEYCKWVSKIYFALSRNDIDKANEYLDEAMDYLSEVEPEIHSYFDMVLFKRRTEQIIKGK